jgi:hypothetical protein
MVRLQIWRHSSNHTPNSSHLTRLNTVSNLEWQLQQQIVSQGHMHHHHISLQHRAIILNSSIKTVEPHIKTLLRVTLRTFTRDNLHAVEVTCYHPSRWLRRSPPKHLISKLLLSNKHREASRHPHMLEGRNIIHISSRWHRLLHLVWNSHRTVDCCRTSLRNSVRHPSQLANGFGKVKENHNLLLSRLQVRPNDLIGRSSLSALRNHVRLRLHARVNRCEKCLNSKSLLHPKPRKVRAKAIDKHERIVSHRR